MGMNVFGQSPVSEQGIHFRNNVWEWHPLWQYCELLVSDLIPADNLGHSNDGWGLDEQDALVLADCLTKALASGETQRCEENYRAYLETLPLEPCELCGGTGYRANVPCNGCHGTGKVANIETYYSFSVENVREFAAFLQDCGGFRIC